MGSISVSSGRLQYGLGVGYDRRKFIAAPGTVLALANGTMAHCMDYDDTHLDGAGHISGPTWAVALALAEAPVLPEENRVLQRLRTGLEIDRLTAAALEKAAIVRHARIPA